MKADDHVDLVLTTRTSSPPRILGSIPCAPNTLLDGEWRAIERALEAAYREGRRHGREQGVREGRLAGAEELSADLRRAPSLLRAGP